jgi:nucleotide-binding universal stress UspA family protein
MAKVIVSYDGTDNDRDALALGKLLAKAGASIALAYVRHAPDTVAEAEALLATGAEQFNGSGVTTHVVLNASTPTGLRDLATEIGADVIVFGSEYRTSPGRVDPQASAWKLLDGGPIAVAVAPAGFHDQNGYEVGSIGPIGEDGDPCVLETAESIAAKLGAAVSEKATPDADLLIVGSKPGTVNGRVRIGAASEYLIELARCPVLVLPRGVAVSF